MVNVYRPCPCGSGRESYPESDAQGIYIGRMCSACRTRRLAGYRPEILAGYTQADVDEPIEPDDGSRYPLGGDETCR